MNRARIRRERRCLDLVHGYLAGVVLLLERLGMGRDADAIDVVRKRVLAKLHLRTQQAEGGST